MTVSAGWTPDPLAPVPKRNTAYRVLVAVAAGWSVLLLFLAITLPEYTVDSTHAGLQPRHSLVRVFGYRVLLIAGIPLVVSLAVGALLRVRSTTGSRWPSFVAGVLAGALLLAAVVGFVTFLIGIYVLPVGVFLCVAVHSDSVAHRASERVSEVTLP